MIVLVLMMILVLMLKPTFAHDFETLNWAKFVPVFSCSFGKSPLGLLWSWLQNVLFSSANEYKINMDEFWIFLEKHLLDLKNYTCVFLFSYRRAPIVGQLWMQIEEIVFTIVDKYECK